MDYGSDAESMSEASDAIRGRDPDGGDVWFVCRTFSMRGVRLMSL